MAAVGTLVLVADADDLVAELKPASGEGKVVGLKTGENKVELPAGEVLVSVATKAGRKVLDQKVDIAAGAAQTLQLTSRGKVVIVLAKDASVAVDDNDVSVDGDKFTFSAAPGSHSVVVQRPGFFGQKGLVDVQIGKTSTVQPVLAEYDAGGKRTIAWAGLLGGGALVVGALVIDATTKFDEFGGDTVRWTLVGAGTAAFVGGTIMLKNAMDEEAPIQDATFQVQVSRAPGGGMVALTKRF
ncbi:MAG: hypothetical protein FJ100_12410 [Deltaproteobacteria bacterium]|nr:hypothetical protein [Deltaproteobacteria bacterium]